MSNLTDKFAALADETRLSVVERLLDEGELPAGALVADATISGPAISRHLKVLRAAGLVHQRADGTKRFYSVRPEGLRAISEWTMDHRSFWEAGLDRLEALLAEEEE
ncbi:ArsR/SmtB family transcription factor [Shimia abyssi]|uniref:ArsR family transcriptional regulator n=1 Tax=Shimia abyssi TaxID=1662395 RepID=A0A2P8F4D5_9RHOB|nr:metalloregulator ArsR/SmtB family transcription factor [Shimia abyssi]PSL16578.1 ArsR family transcriptional regulator [Shimia abyssi]